MIETPGRFEPAFLEGDIPSTLAGLAIDIARESARLAGDLPGPAAGEAATLVAIMNCYYSNLIENQVTRPLDIEAALKTDEKRPLFQEARANVVVQRHIDALHAAGKLPVPTDPAFLRELHRRFYEEMPTENRVSSIAGRTVPIVPGAFRTRREEDVAVGRHQPPGSERVSDFVDAFARRFAMAERSGPKILAIPAAHHRFNYIHPFVDGNGRVSRLMSHAMALRAGIGAAGMWSISRGLARGLHERGEYKRMMDLADTPRQGERDGRGNLSQKALLEFSDWFLTVALDQIKFSRSAFQLDGLAERMKRHLTIRFGDRRHGVLVAKILTLGEAERGSAPTIIGGSERTARSILKQCEMFGFLKSDTPKGRVRVAFPVRERQWLFPGLFADERAQEATPYERRSPQEELDEGKAIWED